MNKFAALSLLMFLSACMSAQWGGNDNEYYTDNTIKNRVGPNGELISPEKCPDWTASPITTYGNEKQGNFGCATVTNLGLMLEDPRDLERGASGGKVSPDPYRSTDAVKNYRGALSNPIAVPDVSPPFSASDQ